jgi:hypothetical protein
MPKTKKIADQETPDQNIVAIQPEPTNKPDELSKPSKPAPKSNFSLDKFKSKRDPTISGVGTLQGALPHGNAAGANDFFRLHPDEVNYWTPTLCFVNVPVKGQKRDTLNLIDEDIATKYLPSAQVKRFRLALGSKPNDVFFLCHVPAINLDNTYNSSAVDGCQKAKETWVKLTSRKDQGVDEYQVTFAFDADVFPEPVWPKQSLDALIEVSFHERMIDRENHPSLLRLLGKKQVLS